jgi:hypothetical protein
MKNKFKIILVLFVLFLSPFIFASNLYAESSNVGFVPSNIWYSKDPFSDGEKIKIYTLLFNQDPRELSGKISFYDRDTLLGRKNFTLKSQEAEVVALEWIVTAGTHTIYARIDDAKFLISNGKYEEVTIAQNESEKSQKIVIKKIAPDLKKIEEDIKEKVEESVGPIENIQDKIVENTPEVISKPVASTINSIKDLRITSLDYINTKKEEVKKEIEELKIENTEQSDQANTETKVSNDTKEVTDEKDVEEDSKKEQNTINKPLKYLSLFFFATLAFILNNKIIFYIILVSLVFIISRFIWRKFI